MPLNVWNRWVPGKTFAFVAVAKSIFFSSIICAVQLTLSDLKFDKIIAGIKTRVQYGRFPKPSLSIIGMHDKNHEKFDNAEIFSHSGIIVVMLLLWNHGNNNMKVIQGIMFIFIYLSICVILHKSNSLQYIQFFFFRSCIPISTCKKKTKL